MKHTFAIALLATLTGVLCAGCRDEISLLEFEEVTYYDDGAADASIVQTEYDSETHRTIIKSGVPSRIIQNGDESLLMLIDNLDDMRLSRSTFNGRAVPVGYLCLDILCFMVDHLNPMFVPDCCDDGLGACYKKGFYFRPDAHVRNGQAVAEAPAIMKVVKANWIKAYREGKVKCSSFEFE